MINSKSDWEVLLIGGSSGAGKSSASQQLARNLGISWMQVDDIRIALQNVTHPLQLPSLHFFVTQDFASKKWAIHPNELCEGLIGVGQVISKAVEPVIRHHVFTKKRIVLEGDGILPSISEKLVEWGINDKVRMLFLVESDEHEILNNMLERGRGFGENTNFEQQAQAQMNWLFGQWIKKEAKRYNVPVIAPRPFSTLINRIEALI